MFYSSHLAVAKKILSVYSAQGPFHLYLKTYFKQNKKHGSRDRKLITALCYNYLRLGFALKNNSLEEKIVIGFFLCEQYPSGFLQHLKPEWNELVSRPVMEKLEIGNWQPEIPNIFPFVNDLNETIDHTKFAVSFLQQPRLFIRIRPGYHKIIVEKLQKNNIPSDVISSGCLALPNSSKIDTVIGLDKEAVIQDYNSQRVGELMQLAFADDPSAINVWDCCAASGGKSILAFDINPLITITVSDKRKLILQNLQERFAKAGIKDYTSFVADLSADKPASVALASQNEVIRNNYDLIIADVPCTGSGTWARTPEQLYYFDHNQIVKYSNLQKQIIKNAIGYLKPGGCLLYITCSVFKKENEEVAFFIEKQLQMDLVAMKTFNGYEMQADTMFAALFKL